MVSVLADDHEGDLIDGGGGVVAKALASGVNGIVINAATTDAVTLRNLSISGAGGGLNGGETSRRQEPRRDNCRFFQFTQNGVDVELNQATRAHVSVHNSSITNNQLNGVFLQNTGGAGAHDGMVASTEIRGGNGGASPIQWRGCRSGRDSRCHWTDIGSYTGRT